MTTLYAMMGVPGSGKSTLANKATDEGYASPDEWRWILSGSKHDQSVSSRAFAMAHVVVHTCLSSMKSVIFDATNVQAKARHDLIVIADLWEAKKVLYVMDTPHVASWEQNLQRDRPVPAAVMARMIVNYEKSFDEIFDEPWDHIVFHSNTKAGSNAG